MKDHGDQAGAIRSIRNGRRMRGFKRSMSRGAGWPAHDITRGVAVWTRARVYASPFMPSHAVELTPWVTATH